MRILNVVAGDEISTILGVKRGRKYQGGVNSRGAPYIIIKKLGGKETEAEEKFTTHAELKGKPD